MFSGVSPWETTEATPGELKVTVTLDPETVIADALSEVDVSNVGDNSEYEVTDSSVVVADDGSFEAEVQVERVTGKFVSKDEIEAIVIEALGEVEGVDI